MLQNTRIGWTLLESIHKKLLDEVFMEKKLLKKVSTIAEKLKRAFWMIVHQKQERTQVFLAVFR